MEQFLTQFRENSLALKVDAAEVDATEANSVGVALPAPMGAITQMRDGTGQANGYEISQSIPFPTKLSSDRRVRQSEASARKSMSHAIRSSAIAKARLLYFGLWQGQERLSLLRERKNAIAQHIRLATAVARSDSLAKIHLLKSESDLDFLDNEITSAEQMVRDRQLDIAEVLNRNPTDFQPVAVEPPLATIPSREALKSPAQIESKKLDLLKLRALEAEAKSSWLPDLNLRYREMGGTSMSPRASEVMIGLSLPFVFPWEPVAKSKKASAERLRGELQLGQETRKIESQKIGLTLKAESLKKQFIQIKEKILPRAEKRMRLVHNLAPRDMETLQDHREAMESFPDLKLKVLEIRSQYEEVVSELQSYTSEGPQ